MHESLRKEQQCSENLIPLSLDYFSLIVGNVVC